MTPTEFRGDRGEAARVAREEEAGECDEEDEGEHGRGGKEQARGLALGGNRLDKAQRRARRGKELARRAVPAARLLGERAREDGVELFG